MPARPTRKSGDDGVALPPVALKRRFASLAGYNEDKTGAIPVETARRADIISTGFCRNRGERGTTCRIAEKDS